jgi:hypothetical protein
MIRISKVKSNITVQMLYKDPTMDVTGTVFVYR